MLLRDMGKAGLAVVVLGTAACSDGSTTATTSGAASTTTFGAGTSTTGVTPSTSSTSAEPPTQADGGFNWHRTNLDFVSAYVLYRGGEAVLVDTGVGGSADSIEASLGEIGLTWDAVGGVILTHSHPDHQGSIGSVLDRASEPPWYAGAGDLSAISAVGGSSVGDGESIFDLEIIETPGHTPGHISVLDPVAGILLAGDSMNGAEGGVTGANPRFTSDMEATNASIVKMGGFDYEVVLLGHGEPILEGGSAKVQQLAETLTG